MTAGYMHVDDKDVERMVERTLEVLMQGGCPIKNCQLDNCALKTYFAAWNLIYRRGFCRISVVGIQTI
jgi:hypothetical protein